MSEKRFEQRDILGIVTFGLFLLLLGLIFAITPNLFDRIYDFFRDFKLRELAPSVYLPAPRSDHPILYNAVYQFCLATWIATYSSIQPYMILPR